MQRKFSTRDVLVAVLLLFGVAMVVAVSNRGDSRPSLFGPKATQAKVDLSDAGPDAPFALTPLDQSPVAPNFTLQTSDGQTVTLADATKKGPVVIDFWATYCEPCRLEMPDIDAVYGKYKSRGLTVYGINSNDGPDVINIFRSANSVAMQMLVDSDGKVTTTYNVTGIPAVAVIDRNMRVRAKNIGYDETTQNDLSSCLDSLLKES